ncbi:hypothetical protein Bbelb_284130 [Branchiostoma belcheri]|nr:hypothetical protein Bbelb_284130 [Branchiostoma belcheri]
MTSDLFIKWLKKFDQKIGRRNRKILLFLDNAPCHSDVTLRNIELKFFPSNTTSRLQPKALNTCNTVEWEPNSSDLPESAEFRDVTDPAWQGVFMSEPIRNDFHADNCNAIGKLTRKGTSKPERPQPRQPAPTRPRRGEPQAGSADHYCLVSMQIKYYSAAASTTVADTTAFILVKSQFTTSSQKTRQDTQLTVEHADLTREGYANVPDSRHDGLCRKNASTGTCATHLQIAALNPKCFALVRDVAEKYQGGGGHINGQGKKREVRQALFEHLKGRAAEGQEMWL